MELKPEQIEALMNSGKQTQFWKFIQDILKTQIDYLTSQLLENEELPIEKVKEFKWKLKIHKRFYDIPQFIIDKTKGGEKPKELNFDPYE